MIDYKQFSQQKSVKDRGAEMEKLNKLLMAWAIEDMRFQTTAYSTSSFTQLPSEQDFEQLCKKPLGDVWKYVVRHVRSKQAVKEIKGNIELNHKLGGQKSYKDYQKSAVISDGERKLLQERADLAREMASCLSDIQQLRKEMSHATDEVMDTELAYQSVRHRVRDLQKKESILEVVNKCAEERVAKYSEYGQRVTKRVHSITKKREGQVNNYVTRGGKNKMGDLETECCRDVRQACEAVGEFLHRIVDGTLVDKVSLENAQKHLWEKIEESASADSVECLISALVTNTEQAAKDMREKTLSVNISKDAEALSFSYDRKTGLHDLSSPPSVQKCVQELLLAGNEQHVMRWFQEQEHVNEEWKLSARLDDVMMDIHKQVHKMMGDHSRNVQLASYIDAKIQLAEEKAVVPCLKAEADSLISRIQKAKQERKELHFKYEKIQDFKTLVEKKQNIITTLARQNSGAPISLDSQKKQVMSYIFSRSMNTHATEVRHLTDDLKSSLVSELVKFASLELSCLITVLLDSNTYQCVLDLSIAPSIHPLAYEKLRTYSDVSAALGFPKYKSTDSLFMHVLQIHDQMQDLHLAQQQRDSSVSAAIAAAHTTDDFNAFIGLYQKAKQHDQAQCDKLLPNLKKRLETVSAHAGRMSDVTNQVNIWWERPAQFITPWVITEGMTFDQWMQRWRVAVTQLHKKMMEDKKQFS